MKNRNTIIILIYLFAFLFILSGCSSGGDSGGGDGNPSTKSDTKISGAAVKGIIKDGLVEIFPITNGQIASQPIATTTTANDGSYSFTLDPNFSGPVLIVVRDNASGTATMKCDNFSGCAGNYNFGDDMPLEEMELKSIIANVSGGAQTGAVTPYTHMAAAYAEQLAATGGYDAAKIAQANSQVGNLLGINNIVTTVPPDVSQLDPANTDVNAMKYAFLSAAIASLAEEQYAGDISAVISALLTTYTSNNGQLISSEFINSQDIISLEELARHAAQQAGFANIESRVSNDLGDLATIAWALVDQPTSAQPSPTSGLGNLDTVKAFVSDVRTWGNVIYDEIEAKNNSAFKQQMEMAEITANTAGPLLGDAFEYGVIVAIEAFVTGVDIDLATFFATYNPTDPDAPPPPSSASGSATITDNTVVVDGQINGVTVGFSIDFPAAESGTQFVLAVSNSSVQNSDMIISIVSGEVTINYDQSVDLSPLLSGNQDADVPAPDSASLDLSVEISELNVDDPISFTGTVTAGMVAAKEQTETGLATIRDIRGNVVNYNPSWLDFTGELGNTNNNFKARIAADMSNADTFMPVNLWRPGIGSYSFANNGDELTIVVPDFTRTITFNNSQITVVESYRWEITPWEYVLPDAYGSMSEFLDSGHYLTRNMGTWVDPIGFYEVPLPSKAADWDSIGGALDGILDDGWNTTGEDANNFREIVNIDIGFSVNLKDLPPASITLTGNRTGLDDGNAIITIAYGPRRIEGTVAVVNGEPTGNITITNQDGVVITLRRDNAANIGEITYNGTKYADIEEVNGIMLIRYSDGYFESI